MSANYKKLFVLSLFCAANLMAGSEVVNTTFLAEKIKELSNKIALERQNLFATQGNFFIENQKNPESFVALIEKGVLPFIKKNDPDLEYKDHRILIKREFDLSY